MAPVPLVKVNKGKFVLCQDGVNFFQSIPRQEPIAVVCLAGAYRTGKSFLLNKLLDITVKQGFKTSSSTDACTQGLWIWADTVPIKRNGEKINLIFIDSEGSGSSHGNEHDSKVFALAVMLSSLFMYNTVGTIEEKHIDSLATIAEVVKSVKRRNKDLANSDFFPELLWILRDFSLQHEGSADDYLSKCLRDVSASDASTARQESIRAQNGARETLRAVFPDHSCLTLVRPAFDEDALNSLDTRSTAIRPEFNAGVDRLGKFIQRHVQPKALDGGLVNGHGLVALAGELIKAFNSDDIPDIRSSWDNIIGFAAIEAKDSVAAEYAKQVDTWMKKHGQTAPPEEYTAWKDKLQNTLLASFDKQLLNKSAHTDKVRQQLIEAMTQIDAGTSTLIQERYEARIAKLLQAPGQKLLDHARRENAKVEDVITHLRSIIETFHVNLSPSEQTKTLLAVEVFLTETLADVIVELCNTVCRQVQARCTGQIEQSKRELLEAQQLSRQLEQQIGLMKTEQLKTRHAEQQLEAVQSELKEARGLERRLGISEVARADLSTSLHQAQTQIAQLKASLQEKETLLHQERAVLRAELARTEARVQQNQQEKADAVERLVGKKRGRAQRDHDAEMAEEEGSFHDAIDDTDMNSASPIAAASSSSDVQEVKPTRGTRGRRATTTTTKSRAASKPKAATRSTRQTAPASSSSVVTKTTPEKTPGKKRRTVPKVIPSPADGKGGASKKLDPANPPSIMKMKSDLREAGIKFKNNAKPAEVRKKWTELAESQE